MNNPNQHKLVIPTKPVLFIFQQRTWPLNSTKAFYSFVGDKPMLMNVGSLFSSFHSYVILPCTRRTSL